MIWLVLALSTLLIFVVDLLTRRGVLDAVPYIFVVLGASLLGRNEVYLTAAFTSALTVLGWYYSPPGADLWVSISNRLLCLTAIWAGVYAVNNAKRAEAWIREKSSLERELEHRDQQLDIVSHSLIRETADHGVTSNRLRESEDRYRAFIAQSREGIWRFELRQPLPLRLPEPQKIDHCYQHSYLAECNDAMAQMYGFKSAGEMVGAPLNNLLDRSNEANVDLLRNFFHSGCRLADFHSVERDKDENVKHFSNTLTGIIVDDCLVRVWGIQQDITGRVQLEAQLRQVQKMEAVGRLAGGVAHDFNNLLNVILGYSDLLLDSPSLPETTRQRVEEIRKAGERATALTRQLLAFSRRQVLQPRTLNLNTVVSDMTSLLRRVIGEDIQLTCNLDQALGSVKADPSQLEQVIMNLVINARDAMPDGGDLVIETRNSELDEFYAGTHVSVVPGPYVMLAVSDTGHGMDAKTQARIFEPFFTTKEKGKGTGLGLATVYGIVKQSGGDIWVYSELAKGTTFKVYLPRVDHQEDLLFLPDPAEQAPRRNERSQTILIAEDDSGVRALLREMLQGLGYKVLEAADGEEAVRLAREHDRTIDLLITDVVMPGLGGRLLFEEVVKHRPSLPALFVSGYTDDVMQQMKAFGPATSFLEKPFTRASLARKIRELLPTS